MLNEKNQPLADHFERTFLTFEELPDYKRYQPPPYLGAPNYNRENRNYWREGAEHFQAKNRLIQIRLELGNRSNFALSAIKLEVTWTSGGQGYRMLTKSEVPDLPADEWHFGSLPRGGRGNRGGRGRGAARVQLPPGQRPPRRDPPDR